MRGGGPVTFRPEGESGRETGADRDDPSNQQGECAMDRGRWSTETAEDADDRDGQACGGADAEQENCEGEQEFHLT